jgi:hypothetical protein
MASQPTARRQHQEYAEGDENHLTESPAVATYDAIEGIGLLGMTNLTLKAITNVLTPARVMPNELNPRETQ